MAEYINKAELETIYCRKGCAECKNEMCLDEMLRGLPTIDIVHCKDCKWWNHRANDEFGECCENGCTIADWFCADGKRRTE